MGHCESICGPVTSCDQLESVFYRDKNAGLLLLLTQQQKDLFWSNIKTGQLPRDVPSRFYADESKKDKGLIYLPEKYLYQGAIKNELANGRGKLNILLEKVVAQGMFKDGKLDGEGSLLFVYSQIKIKGIWAEGVPLKIDFRTQKGKFSIEFQGKSLEKGLITFPNKNRYRGQFRFDLQEKIYIMEGNGTLTYSNGDILQGQFVNGFLQGQGVYQSANKLFSYKGCFKKGLFNGQGKADLGEQGILHINWINNKPDGRGELQINNRSYRIFYEKGVRKQQQSDIQE